MDSHVGSDSRSYSCVSCRRHVALLFFILFYIDKHRLYISTLHHNLASKVASKNQALSALFIAAQKARLGGPQGCHGGIRPLGDERCQRKPGGFCTHIGLSESRPACDYFQIQGDNAAQLRLLLAWSLLIPPSHHPLTILRRLFLRIFDQATRRCCVWSTSGWMRTTFPAAQPCRTMRVCTGIVVPPQTASRLSVSLSVS